MAKVQVAFQSIPTLSQSLARIYTPPSISIVVLRIQVTLIIAQGSQELSQKCTARNNCFFGLKWGGGTQNAFDGANIDLSFGFSFRPVIFPVSQFVLAQPFIYLWCRAAVPEKNVIDGQFPSSSLSLCSQYFGTALPLIFWGGFLFSSALAPMLVDRCYQNCQCFLGENWTAVVLEIM